MGIGDKLKRPANDLSQGEKQRVAICRALLPEPRLLLADEATGNLDPPTRRCILDLLFDSVDAHGATLLAVTHDHELLPRFDQVVDFADFARPAGHDRQLLRRLALPELQLGRSLTLVACVTLIAFLPLSLELLLDESQRQLLSRAETTPLVVGAKGSSLDLVMNSLYFGDTVPELISMAAVDRVARPSWRCRSPCTYVSRHAGFPSSGPTWTTSTFAS